MTPDVIDRARAGDERACVELYRESIGYATRVATKILRNAPNEVEDVAHEVVTRALLKLDSFHGGSKFRTWLHRIAFNMSLMRLRACQSRGLGFTNALEVENDDGGLQTLDVAVIDPEFARLEATADLQKLMSALSPINAEAALLCHLEGWTIEEAAAVTGATKTAIKTRVYNAIKQTRRRALRTMSTMNTTVAPSAPSSSATADVKRRCVECARHDRFRFADELVNEVPLCRWCAKAANGTNSAITRRQKTCVKCGNAFSPTGNRQVYCAGCRVTVHPAQPRPQSTVALAAEQPGAGTVTVTIPIAVLDTMWASLDANQKAKAFEFVMSR